MDLFSAIGNYIDRGVDWVAEAIGYDDIELPDDLIFDENGRQNV